MWAASGPCWSTPRSSRSGQGLRRLLVLFEQRDLWRSHAGAIPTPETYRGNVSCTGPRACYDESKRYGETLCVNFTQQHGLPIKVARPFNNYGPASRSRTPGFCPISPATFSPAATS